MIRKKWRNIVCGDNRGGGNLSEFPPLPSNRKTFPKF